MKGRYTPLGMSKEDKIAITKDRYNRLKQSQKNIKCPGVLRKLERELRNAGIEV